MIEIAVVDRPTSEIADAVSQLLPQLSSGAAQVDESSLRSIVASPATRLFVARDGPAIVGMLTLVLVRIPTGLRAYIEDVVVRDTHRRRGIGMALTQAALAAAEAAGARTVNLTSNAKRQAANQLYEKMGFRRRDTNVFRLIFDRA